MFAKQPPYPEGGENVRITLVTNEEEIRRRRRRKKKKTKKKKDKKKKKQILFLWQVCCRQHDKGKRKRVV